jgi:hypothetical protein
MWHSYAVHTAFDRFLSSLSPMRTLLLSRKTNESTWSDPRDLSTGSKQMSNAGPEHSRTTPRACDTHDHD